MKTNWFGNILIALTVNTLCVFAGMAYGTYDKHKTLTKLHEENFIIEKEHWHCFVGVLFENGFECFSYKRKDADFGQFSGPRRGDNDIPKGKPVQQM